MNIFMKIAVFCPHKIIELLRSSLANICDDVLYVYEEENVPSENEYHFVYQRDSSYEFLNEEHIELVIVYGWNYLIPVKTLKQIDFYNVHASPLPKYRGPYPVVFQLLNKENKIGITIHKMDETYDTGDIYLQKFVNVDYNRLSYLEVNIFRAVQKSMLQLIKDYLNNNICSLLPQSNDNASYYSKKDLINYLNSKRSLNEFFWMNKIFNIYKPFKVLINSNVYIIEEYSMQPQNGFTEFQLKDAVIYLKFAM